MNDIKSADSNQLVICAVYIMVATAELSLTGSTLQLDAQLIEYLIELFHGYQPFLKVVRAAVKEAAKDGSVPLNICRLTIFIQAVTEKEVISDHIPASPCTCSTYT